MPHRSIHERDPLSSPKFSSLEGLDEFGSLGIEGFEHLWDVQRQFSFMFLFHSDINKDDAFRDVLYCIVYCIASFFPSASHKFESNDNVVSEIRLREAFICWIKHCEVVPLLGNVWGAYHPLDTNSLVSKHEKNCGENSPIAKRPSLWWKLGVWPTFGKGQLRRSETVVFGVFFGNLPGWFFAGVLKTPCFHCSVQFRAVEWAHEQLPKPT